MTQLNHLALIIDEIDNGKLNLLLDKLAAHNVGVLSLYSRETDRCFAPLDSDIVLYTYPLNQGRERLLSKFKQILLDNTIDLDKDLTAETLFALVADDREYPEPDLIVKVDDSEELSLDNNVILEVCYAEILFIKKSCDKFEVEKDLSQAFEDFALRKRNFGS